MYILKELYIQQKDIVGYSGDNFGNILLTKTSNKIFGIWVNLKVIKIYTF